MKLALKLTYLTLLLIGLPLAGLVLNGLDINPYLEFPPSTRYVSHAPFSWMAFVSLSLFLALVITPFVFRAFRSIKIRGSKSRFSFPFLWWGWGGLFLLSISWMTAWTRIPCLSPYQPHTFTPLWISFILIINAITYSRKGKCLLTDCTLIFFLLFPLSAAFWWFFEYLNRFVQNWHYVGVKFEPWEYFLYATLPFSTVLPAVTSTREWLLTFDWPEKQFSSFLSYRFPKPKLLAFLILFLSSTGLFYIGLYPDYLFPLLWISPLLIFVSLQELFSERHIFTSISRGYWATIVTSALAALICGFFWEMWNFGSLAKWKYAIPFVDCCKIFEMPLLGYAGYFPFGLECSVIAGIIFHDEKMRAKKAFY